MRSNPSDKAKLFTRPSLQVFWRVQQVDLQNEASCTSKTGSPNLPNLNQDAKCGSLRPGSPSKCLILQLRIGGALVLHIPS